MHSLDGHSIFSNLFGEKVPVNGSHIRQKTYFLVGFDHSIISTNTFLHSSFVCRDDANKREIDRSDSAMETKKRTHNIQRRRKKQKPYRSRLLLKASTKRTEKKKSHTHTQRDTHRIEYSCFWPTIWKSCRECAYAYSNFGYILYNNVYCTFLYNPCICTQNGKSFTLCVVVRGPLSVSPFLSHLLSKCTATTDTVGSLLPCNSQRQIYARIVCFVAEAKFLTHSSAQATMTARE